MKKYTIALGVFFGVLFFFACKSRMSESQMMNTTSDGVKVISVIDLFNKFNLMTTAQAQTNIDTGAQGGWSCTTQYVGSNTSRPDPGFVEDFLNGNQCLPGSVVLVPNLVSVQEGRGGTVYHQNATYLCCKRASAVAQN